MSRRFEVSEMEPISRSSRWGRAVRPEWRAASGLLTAWVTAQPRPIRLIGVAVSELSARAGAQLSLFEEDRRDARLDAAVDALRERFGPDAVRRAGPGKEV